MSKNTVFIVFGLTLIWLILLEGFTVIKLVTGIAAAVCSVVICSRFLPLPQIAKDINLFRFALYPFYLLAQVYLSAFTAIKLTFTGADVSVFEVKTQLSNSFLRIILANSITLTPGSISLEIKDDIITLLWLKGKKESLQDAEKAGNSIKCKLERILKNAEK